MDLIQIMEHNSIDFINNNIEDLKIGINQSTILLKIFYEEDKEALRHFVNSGLDINIRMQFGKTVIHHIENTSVDFLEEMVALGLNIHAVDENGDTALLVLAEKDINLEVQSYLMNKGLNPYNFNFRGRNCFSYVKITRKNTTVDFYAQFPYLRMDPTVNTLLVEGKYEMALNTVYFEINNIGGSQKVFNNLHNTRYSILFSQLQNCLCMLGRIEEANALLRIFNTLPRKRIANFKDTFPTPIAAFIMKDYDTLYNYLDVMAIGNYNKESKKESALLHAFIFASIIGNEEDIAERKRIMNAKRFKNGLNTAFLKKLIFSKKEYDILEREKMLNIMAENGIPSKASEIRYNESLYYLMKGDLILAELKLRQVMDISHELKFYLKEYFSAKLLIDYIQTIKQETK